MKTFYRETRKNAIVEANLIGSNPTRIDESIWVFFKKETSGKYTAEIHSNKAAVDMAWSKGNNPWSNEQMLVANLYGVKPSYSNVLRFKTDYKDIREAVSAKNDLITIAKRLTQM
jgi:hypothetical protein